MKVLKFCLLAFILIQGCNENKKDNQDSYSFSNSLFTDQKELKLDDKYFTMQIDSFGTLDKNFYRYDINSYQLLRFWSRYYNNMYEFRFTNHYPGDFGSNYLFGIRYVRSKTKVDPIGTAKAFYIRWKNEFEGDIRFNRGTSDISKFTVELQTNLPREIILHYYPEIKCSIEYKYQNKAIIKYLNIGDIFQVQNYNPFK